MKITVTNVGTAIIAPDRKTAKRKPAGEIPNYIVYPTIDLMVTTGEGWNDKLNAWLAEFAPGWVLKGWVQS